MKAYQGINALTKQHVVDGDGIANGAVKGCHDTDNFLTRHANTTGPERVLIRSRAEDGPLTRFEYSTFNKNTGQPNTGIKDKTTLQTR